MAGPGGRRSRCLLRRLFTRWWTHFGISCSGPFERCRAGSFLVKILGKGFGGIPPLFFKECARELFCWGCGSMIFGSVEGIDMAGVAGVRECVLRDESGIDEGKSV